MNRRQFLRKTILAVTALGFADSFFIERYFVDWNYIDLSNNPKNKIKIIQLTDLHFKGLNRKYRKIVEKINKIRPDLIVFTGDCLDDKKHTNEFNQFLQLLNYDIKKLAILGNWEHWANIDIKQLKSIYNKANCELLINENSQLTFKDRAINVIGIDDLIGGHPNLDVATNLIKENDYSILLSHCPAFRDKIPNDAKQEIDLILSGHTHGGQINLFGYVPFLPEGSGRYLSGLYNDNNKPLLYVSKGIGTSILPFRFCSRAEITLLEV